MGDLGRRATTTVSRGLPGGLARWVLSLAVFVSLVSMVPSAAAAQDPGDLTVGETLYEFHLSDGTMIVARVIEVVSGGYVLATPGGTRVEVARDQIESVIRAEGSVSGGAYLHPDPRESRLFFAQTGRNLPAGTAQFGTFMVIAPYLELGLTDFLSIGVGAPLLVGEMEPLYVAPKIQLVESGPMAVSVGVLGLVLDDDHVGFAYGVGTFGDDRRALHLGMGWGFSGDDFANEPAGLVGGELRVTRRVKIISENYWLPGDEPWLLSGGLRFIGERLAADLGVVGLADEGCCFPAISISYEFSRSSR